MRALTVALAAVALATGAAVGLCGDRRADGDRAASAILIDACSGRVLYERNARERRSVASTTKIMTGLLIIERGSLQDVVTVGQGAADTENSSLLEAGEHISLENLLKAILIQSANDAATAAAEHVFGSVSACCAAMNRRARALGAKDTQFANPHGLHERDHYSTAHDLALIAREAMRHALFRVLVSTQSTVIPWEGHDGGRHLRNHNRLLTEVPQADGIKTGFVKESGRCLAFSATRNGCRMIGVLLDSPNLWKEAADLIAYGERHYQPVRLACARRAVAEQAVAYGEPTKIPLVPAHDLGLWIRPDERDRYLVRPRAERLRAPVRAGARAGVLKVFDGKRLVASVPLEAGAASRYSAARAWRAWLLRGVGLLILAFLLVRTYGAVAKSHGRSWRGVAARLRGLDPRRSSDS